MVQRNTKLKALLFMLGVSQRELSRKTEIPESYLSLALHGRYVLDEEQRRRIAESLGLDTESVFTP
jgi:transcriptional regulator with XRE-family HTH domain